MSKCSIKCLVKNQSGIIATENKVELYKTKVFIHELVSLMMRKINWCY